MADGVQLRESRVTAFPYRHAYLACYPHTDRHAIAYAYAAAHSHPSHDGPSGCRLARP